MSEKKFHVPKHKREPTAFCISNRDKYRALKRKFPDCAITKEIVVAIERIIDDWEQESHHVAS